MTYDGLNAFGCVAGMHQIHTFHAPKPLLYTSSVEQDRGIHENGEMGTAFTFMSV